MFVQIISRWRNPAAPKPAFKQRLLQTTYGPWGSRVGPFPELPIDKVVFPARRHEGLVFTAR